MTANDYAALPDDGFRYELIDGVVIMSLSPTPNHQRVLFEISRQLGNFLVDHPIGEAVPEVDIVLGPGLVYRPELIFIRNERLRRPMTGIDVVPDLVVEVLSPSSEMLDRVTKKSDYERFGVAEYWLIEPEEKTATFFRLVNGAYRDVPANGDTFTSEVVAGFKLDLAAIRKAAAAFGESPGQ